MDVSINTLMLAIKAIDRDIDFHKSRAEESASEDGDGDGDGDPEYHGEYALDLLRALGELAEYYENARRHAPEYPSFEQLTASR